MSWTALSAAIRRLPPIAWIVVVVATALAPMITGQGTFAGGDQELRLLPYAVTLGTLMAAGQGWLWAPTLLGGFPLYATILGGAFAPLTWLSLWLLPPLDAYHLLVVANAIVAAGATALLVKQLGGSREAQIISGLTWVLSQWRLIPDWGVMMAFSVLPLLLLAVRTSVTNRWVVLGGAAVIGYGWLSVHYQWQLMALVAGGFWALLLGARALRRFLVMAIAGTLLGLPLLLPAMVYQQESLRSTALPYAEASAWAVTPLDAGRLLLPHLWLPSLPWAEGQVYAGLLPVLLATLGLIWVLRRRWPGPQAADARRIVWLGAAALLTALMYSPIFWLLHALPVFGTLRSPARWLYLTFFCVAVLAGLTADRLRANDPALERTRRWLTRVSTGLLVLVATAALALLAVRPVAERLMVSYVRNAYASQPRELALDHYLRVGADMINRAAYPLDLREPAVWHTLLALAAILLALRQLRERRPRAGAALAAVVAFDLLVVMAPAIHYLPRQLYQTPSATATYVRDHEPGYVQSFLAEKVEWQMLTTPYGYNAVQAHQLKRALITPNLGMLDGIATWDGYDNLMSRRVSRLLAAIGSDRATVGDSLANATGTLQAKAEVLAQRKPILNRLGIRYLTSAVPLAQPLFTHRLTSTTTDVGIPVYLYENEGARPFVYLADAVQTIPPDETVAFTLVANAASSTPDVLECAACPPLGAHPRGSARLLTRQPQDLTIETSTNAAALVVILQSALPGWTAEVDGTSTPIYIVNSVTQGVVVPAGTHTIKLRYHYSTVISTANRYLKNRLAPAQP